MKLPKPLAIVLLVCAAQISGMCADIAVLRNGFTIRHERREQIGNITRLYTDSGYVDIATDQIASFEKEELPPPEFHPAATTPDPATADQKPANPTSPAATNLDQVVRDASSHSQLDPDFVNSVIKYESGFRARAVSPKGAQGLMQLMPATAAQLGVTNAFDVKENVEAGTTHLRQLLELYNGDPIKALAAYNAGAHRVEQYHGVPPYRETRLYITRIVRDFNEKKRAQMKASLAQSKPSTPTDSKTQTAGTTKAAAKTARGTRSTAKRPSTATTPNKTVKPKDQPTKVASLDESSKSN